LDGSTVAGSAHAKEEFGARLKRMLSERGIRHMDLAEQVGVTPNTVSSWTTGAGTPRGRNLREIARVLRISVGALLGDEPEPVRVPAESERLVRRLAELGLAPTVRALAAATPDLMAILSEAERQVEQHDRTLGSDSPSDRGKSAS
jgi:transcriptional regulator with XRE-family HTH domain